MSEEIGTTDALCPECLRTIHAKKIVENAKRDDEDEE